MTDRGAYWDEVYEARGEADVSWFEAMPSMSLDLILRASAAKATAIVDVGGGLSRLADHLIVAGYVDVTVLDVSAAATQQLAARIGSTSLSVIVNDITTWIPQRTFDLWHDRAVLHFLTDETDRRGYRRALLDGLAPGGQLIIATFALTGPERCSGLPVRRYGRDELAEFLGAEFEQLESFEHDHRTPAGDIQRFHIGRFRRLP